MITKAIIESDQINNQYRIRIPKYHKLQGVSTSTPTDQLPFATVCYIPGIIPIYSVGDIVYVDFENDDLSFPVILGKLLCDDNKDKTLPNIKANSLSVDIDTRLSNDTQIGTVTYTDIRQTVNSIII